MSKHEDQSEYDQGGPLDPSPPNAKKSNVVTSTLQERLLEFPTVALWTHEIIDKALCIFKEASTELATQLEEVVQFKTKLDTMRRCLDSADFTGRNLSGEVDTLKASNKALVEALKMTERNLSEITLLHNIDKIDLPEPLHSKMAATAKATRAALGEGS